MNKETFKVSAPSVKRELKISQSIIPTTLHKLVEWCGSEVVACELLRAKAIIELQAYLRPFLEDGKSDEFVTQEALKFRPGMTSTRGSNEVLKAACVTMRKQLIEAAEALAETLVEVVGIDAAQNNAKLKDACLNAGMCVTDVLVRIGALEDEK